MIHFGCWLAVQLCGCSVHPPCKQSSGACARLVAMGCSEGGGASALLQLSMVAYGSQRGFGYVRDASIVTLRGFKNYNLLGSLPLLRIRADGKVSRRVQVAGLSPIETLALALVNECWPSILALHHEQARKQTNMDAVRYSSAAAADACAEIMLPGSYSLNVILLIDSGQQSAIYVEQK